jgi:hypothetical protein
MSSQGNFPIIVQFRETPLIDRINELQFLKQAANRATIDQGGLVFLRGEAGIGKTRVTKEIQAYARSHGMKIFYGKSAGLFSEIGQQSYFIWKTVIRDYLRSCTPEQLQKAVGYYPGEIYKIVPEVKNKLILFSWVTTAQSRAGTRSAL